MCQNAILLYFISSNYFSFHRHLKSLTILCEIWTIKQQQMAKMSNWVPNERLGTSRLSNIFLKNIYLYDSTLNFQERLWFNIHAKYNKHHSVRQIFCKLRDCEIKNSSKSVFQVFLQILTLNVTHPDKSTVKILFKLYGRFSSNPWSKTGF